jgi:hypothetical protein
MGERQRKKLLKLDERQWEQVRVFVQEFFQQQPEKASKATYKSLINEIQGQYPCIILSKSSFQKHVALIEFESKCWHFRQNRSYQEIFPKGVGNF